jgi:DNA repair protein RadC
MPDSPSRDTSTKNNQNGIQISCGKLTISWLSSQNLLDKIRAEKSVIIMLTNNDRALAEVLEWSPSTGQINLKSTRQVRIWYKNSECQADEIIIFTNPQNQISLSDWYKIETRNIQKREIKIAPSEKE